MMADRIPFPIECSPSYVSIVSSWCRYCLVWKDDESGDDVTSNICQQHLVHFDCFVTSLHFSILFSSLFLLLSSLPPSCLYSGLPAAFRDTDLISFGTSKKAQKNEKEKERQRQKKKREKDRDWVNLEIVSHSARSKLGLKIIGLMWYV